MTMPSTIVGGGAAGSSRRQRATGPAAATPSRSVNIGRRFQWPGVARLVCAARWVFLVFIRAHRRVMICAAAPATSRIARLAEADSQVRRPALRIVLPGCSIRDQGRWVCAFRRDGSPAALADAGGSAPRRRRPGRSADFMDIPSPPIRGPPRNERGSHCRPRRGCPWPARTRCQLAPIPGWRRS